MTDPHDDTLREDVRVGVLALFLALLAGGLVVVGGVAWFALSALRPLVAGADGAGGEAPRLPPEPRLQTTPARDLAQLRAAEDAWLEGYAWVDEEHAHVPIERAMELRLEEAGR